MVRGKIFKDVKGFTGLEAAITLIAFVTVAAVFSYVLLGAGFFSTQKGQEVVHTGVQQVSSSIEVIGSIIGHGDTNTNTMKDTIFTIQLAAGATPIDLSKTVITVTNPKDGIIHELKYTTNETVAQNNPDSYYYVNWVVDVNGGTPDDYLEEFEKAEITINLTNMNLDPNEIYQIEIKPPMGATYPIELKVPPSIDPTMVLLQ